MHLSVEQEAALETGGAQLLILILNNCKIKYYHYQHVFLHLGSLTWLYMQGIAGAPENLTSIFLFYAAFQEDDKRRKPLHPSYPRV